MANSLDAGLGRPPVTPSYYEPDCWTILALRKEGEPPILRALVSWRQTYLSGEEWRASSPITCIEQKGGRVVIQCESGSVYSCPKSNYWTTGCSQQALEGLMSEGEKVDIVVEVLPVDQVIEQYLGRS